MVLGRCDRLRPQILCVCTSTGAQQSSASNNFTLRSGSRGAGINQILGVLILGGFSLEKKRLRETWLLSTASWQESGSGSLPKQDKEKRPQVVPGEGSGWIAGKISSLKEWSNLAQQVVESPSLGGFKGGVNVALHDLVQWTWGYLVAGWIWSSLRFFPAVVVLWICGSVLALGQN